MVVHHLWVYQSLLFHTRDKTEIDLTWHTCALVWTCITTNHSTQQYIMVNSHENTHCLCVADSLLWRRWCNDVTISGYIDATRQPSEVAFLQRFTTSHRKNAQGEKSHTVLLVQKMTENFWTMILFNCLCQCLSETSIYLNVWVEI